MVYKLIQFYFVLNNMNLYLILGILILLYLGIENSKEYMSIPPHLSFLRAAENAFPTNELPYSLAAGNFDDSQQGIPYHVAYIPCNSCRQSPSLFPYYTWDGE